MSRRMQLHRLWLAAGLAFASGPAHPQAAPEGPPALAVINGWSIFENQDNCAAIQIYEGDLTIDVALYFARDRVLLDLTNPAWASVQRDAHYSVTVTFDNGSTYDGNATGMVGDGDQPIRGLIIPVSGIQFLADLSQANSMRVTMGDRRLASVRLDGTRAVVDRLATCAAQGARHHPPDVFEGVEPSTRR